MAVNPFDTTGLDLIVREATSTPLQPGQVDVEIDIQPPQPVGRSWAFDWQARSFVTGTRSRGPIATRGLASIEGWIAKCLSTARGAHVIHPPKYGILRGATDLISRQVGFVPADFAERVREALTFHPRVADVRDFAYDYDPGEEWTAVSFTVVLDDESAVTINTRVAA
jgi:hypothetical protein